MKKILLIGYSSFDPASRYRLKQFVPFLTEKGYQASFTYVKPNVYYRPSFKSKLLFWGGIYLKNIFREISLYLLIFRALFYDVIWINRPLHSGSKTTIGEKVFIKLFSNKIIFDFDDAIHLVGDGIHLAKVSFYIRSVNRVFAGNDYLNGFSSQLNTKSLVIPTVINTDKYRVKKQELDGKVVIGWVGSSSTQSVCLPAVKEVLLELGRRINDEFELLIISDVKPSFLWLKQLNWRFEEWDENREIELVHQIDIGIMPLNNTKFEQGKCGFKLLQYGGVGLPSVASPIGVNNKIIKHGVNGYLPENASDWVSLLLELIKNKELREAMGQQARTNVEREYSINSVLPEVIESINKLSCVE